MFLMQFFLAGQMILKTTKISLKKKKKKGTVSSFLPEYVLSTRAESWFGSPSKCSLSLGARSGRAGSGVWQVSVPLPAGTACVSPLKGSW